jgi:hypothetical protein
MKRLTEVLVSLFFLLFSVTLPADSLEQMRADGMQCVEPTDIMRKQHMQFLLHQRDLTMRQGIRTEQHSLNQCVECHVQKNNQGEFIPINAPEQFCAACHTFTSVSIDCFDCHATTPDLPQSAKALIQRALGQLIAQELTGSPMKRSGDSERKFIGVDRQ